MLAHPFIRYLLSLGSVIGCYLVYQTAFVPLIDGEQKAVVSAMRNDIGHADPKQGLHELFAPNSWELQPCKVVETSQGKLLFQKFTKRDDGKVEVTPLTLVVGLDEKNSVPGSKERPFVIQAASSAILEFDKPFSLTGGIGKIEGGQLVGDVRIYRMATDATSDDAIEIQTYNVEISPNKIYTLNNVGFRFGSSHGRGKNLAIDLSDTQESSNDLPIEKIELTNLEYLHIDRSKPEAENLILQSSQTPDALEVDPLGSIDITCTGGFQIDLKNLVASFKNHVRVLGVDSGDELLCDQLWLYLRKQEKTATETTIVEESKKPKSNFEIERVVALGQPAKLLSNGHGGSAEAEHLQFDLIDRRIHLRGNRPVVVERENQFIQAREVEYILNEDGSLGNTVAVGPGQIVQSPETNESDDAEAPRSFSCSWNGNLTIKPDGNKKLIAFDSRASVLIDGENQLAGDQIQFWLWETEVRSADNNSSKWQLEPCELRAVGNVTLESSRLSGRTQTLTATWPAPTAGNANFQARQFNGYSIGNPKDFSYSVNQQSQYVSLRPSFQELVVEEKPVRIIRFQGDAVQLQLAEGIDERDFRIEQITVNGNVIVSQDSTQGKSDSLEIRGDTLKATQVDDELYRLNVIGTQQKNALASINEIQLVGEVINLDQAYNRLWINGPGRMAVERPKEGEQPVDNQNRKPETTNILWNGGMVFDGQTFYVEGDVTTLTNQANEEGGTSEIQTTSEALNARLDQVVDFKNQREQTSRKIELDKIVLAGSLDPSTRVFPANSNQQQASGKTTINITQRDERNQIVGVQTITVPDATIDSKTGKFQCNGPGVVQGLQVAGNGATRLASTNSGTRQRRPKLPFEYVQVKYEKTLDGNLRGHDIVFTGKVRSVYSPVSDWKVQLDADNKQVAHPDALRLVCERMQLIRWARKTATEPQVEMIATGSAQANGQRFEAIANRISYNQQNGNVLLQSNPRHDAELFYQKEGSSNRDHMTAETIRYNVITGETEVDRFKQIDVTHQGPLLNRDK